MFKKGVGLKSVCATVFGSHAVQIQEYSGSYNQNSTVYINMDQIRASVIRYHKCNSCILFTVSVKQNFKWILLMSISAFFVAFLL